MKKQGIFSVVNSEVGDIIVADVSTEKISELLQKDGKALGRLIAKQDA